MAEPHPHLPEWMFHAYLDRELAPEERTALEAHVRSCPTCAQALSELEALFQAIVQVPEVPLERDLAAAVLPRLELRSPGNANGLRWLLGLELAVVVLLLGILGPTLASYGERLVARIGQALPYLPRWQELLAAPVAWLEPIPAVVVSSAGGSVPLLGIAALLGVLWVLGNIYLLGHSSVEAR